MFVAGENFNACPVAMTVVEEGSGPSAKPDVVHAQTAEIIGNGGTQFTIKLHVVGLLVFSGMEGDSHGV